MKNSRFNIEMDLTGVTRKKAAEVLSEYFQKPLEYDNATDIYSIKDQFDRNWLVTKTDDILCQRKSGDNIVGANFLYNVKLCSPQINYHELQKIEDVIGRLQSAGALANDSTKLNIILDGTNNNVNSLKNLDNMLESKAELICKAIGTENFNTVFTSGSADGSKTLSFPMFKSSMDSDVVKSFVQLSNAINSQILTQNSISPKKNPSPNEKYTFRTWLLRLGMIGEDFKAARSVLMENLSGNSAWKNPQLQNNNEMPTQENPEEQKVENHEQNQEQNLEQKLDMYT